MLKRIKNKGHKKTIVAILIALVVFGLFYYFSKDEKNSLTTAHNKPYEPSFKKEGELFFIAPKSDTIKKIDIEVAADDYERTQGLMYRRSMADSLGMLFVFKKEEPQSFWMRNTYISLDIIYVNKQFEIVTIQRYTEPLSDNSIPSNKPAMYVVETNAGFCDKYKIKEGDKIYYRLVIN